ncbi:MAG: TorF family putative porin [Erythrobacter sp.]
MSYISKSLFAVSIAAVTATIAAPARAQETPAPSATPDTASESDLAALDGAEGTALAFGLPPAPPKTAPLKAAGPVDEKIASRFDAPGGFTLSANVALASEYRFRGVNLSGGKIALQGGFDVSHTTGFYAGTWASTLDDTTIGYGELELDLYGGWTGDVAKGLTLDVGFIAYTYPYDPPGDFDYYEVYGSLGFDIGPASAKLGFAYDPEQAGLKLNGASRDNLYTFGNVSIGIPSTPITFDAHLGYTDGALSLENDIHSFDWSLGISAPVIGPFIASLAYVEAQSDVAQGAFNPTKANVVAILKASCRFPLRFDPGVR